MPTAAGVDLQKLMIMGAKLLPHTFAKTDDPLRATELWTAYLHALYRTDPGRAGPLIAWTEDKIGFGVMIWGARWASCAFPEIVVGPKLCASLMATSAAPDVAGLVGLPWKAFLVRIAPGLLSGISALTGAPVPLDLLFVDTTAEGGLHLMLASRNHDLALHHGARTLAELATADVLDDTSRRDPAFFDLEDHDQRALLLGGRLLLGVLLELASDEHRDRYARGPGSRSKRQGLPKAWTFELRREVRLDVRTPIRQFVQGQRGGASPTVQTLVGGHWKQQPHGPGAQLRKLIQIEPYWRGPEDAPIAVRARRLRDRE